MNGQETRGSGLQKTGLRQQRPSSLCRSSRDPPYIARKAETYLTSARIGDRAYFGPELEHFVFNEVHYDQGVNYGYYEIDAVEANWKASQSRRFSHIMSRTAILTEVAIIRGEAPPHDHDLGFQHDLGAFFNRRRALALVASMTRSVSYRL